MEDCYFELPSDDEEEEIEFDEMIDFVPDLVPASDEQMQIIDSLQQGYNVVVDSVAGSGKTTCNLHIAKTIPKQILLLTYNAKLKVETREKVKLYGLDNIEVHSYHSFCVKYYSPTAYTDSGIISVLENNTIPLSAFHYDIIICDEAQDISEVYYKLICKLYSDNITTNHMKRAQIGVFGDVKQSIFVFNGADSRYITMANQVFNMNEYEWRRHVLSVSFRVTNPISAFINTCMLREERIHAVKPSVVLPRYIICNTFNKQTMLDDVMRVLNQGYTENDVMIIAPSVRKCRPIQELENAIKTNTNLMVYASASDTEKIDKDITQNKIIISTFHQVKGMERKVVFVLGFDSSYFKYYKRDANQMECPNELYVAATRASERLILFHSYQHEYLPFINRWDLPRFTHMSEYRDIDIKEQNALPPGNKLRDSVTNLIRFLPQTLINSCIDKLDICTVQSASEHIDIPLKIRNKVTNTFESVCDINGIAIPAYYGYILNKNTQLLDSLQAMDIFSQQTEDAECLFSTEETKTKLPYDIQELDMSTLTPPQLLFISNCWWTHMNKFLYKLYQIKEYKWLKMSHMRDCMRRMKKLKIGKNAEFEYRLDIVVTVADIECTIVGYCDCIDFANNCVYEFKCVQSLDETHFIQMAVYMFILLHTREEHGRFHPETMRYFVYNIYDDKKVEIKASYEELYEIMEKIVYYKRYGKEIVDDEEFLAKARLILSHAKLSH